MRKKLYQKAIDHAMKNSVYRPLDKLNYYFLRMDDKDLTKGQRSYAFSFVRGVEHCDKDLTDKSIKVPNRKAYNRGQQWQKREFKK